MIKKLVLLIIIFLVVITGILTYLSIIKQNEIEEECFAEEEKVFLKPDYNAIFISNIHNIEVQNPEIKNKYQFVYISDLHGTVLNENEKSEQLKQSLEERYNMFYKNESITPDDRFKEIISYTNNTNSDALLLGGDIIDCPAESNFKLLTYLNDLNKEYLYTFGNHDWTFMWDYQTEKTKNTYYPKFKEYMDDYDVSYLEYKDLIILAINDSSDKIDESAIEKIKTVLDKKKPTIVMLHVPISTKYISEEAIRIRNRVSAIGDYGIEPDINTKKVIDMILSKENKVFYVISGHVHFAVNDNLNENIIEDVSAPAYDGNINIIKINQ